MKASLTRDPPRVVPAHIAIVMDGNGRWATRRLLPRLAGHRQGMESLRRCIRACLERGVAVLTVFAFSSENWNRPAEEVSGLMELLAGALAKEVPQMHADGVRLYFVGERETLSEKVRTGLIAAEQATAGNHRLVLNVCFNYGGRWDLVQAAAKLAAAQVEVTEATLGAALSLSHVADPDLVVRTGGELRLSNFLLWQAAYAELYFSEMLWPDFDEAELDRAIAAYSQRERRYGRVPAQATAPTSGPRRTQAA